MRHVAWTFSKMKQKISGKGYSVGIGSAGGVTKFINALFSCVPFLFLISSAIPAEIYHWKDKDGKIHFSDTPPPAEVDVEIRQFKDNPSAGPKTKGEPPKSKSESLREKRPYGRINVIMYMTSWCPVCGKARGYLNFLGINLTEYNIEKDKAKREEMLLKSGGSKGVPLIDVEGIIIRGFSESAIKAAVEKKRDL